MSDHDVLDNLSPETRAQFEQLKQYLDRVAPPWLRYQPKRSPRPDQRQHAKRQMRRADAHQLVQREHSPTASRPFGRRRSLLEGRDLPAMSELFSRKRYKWREWLWRAVLRESIQLVAEVGTRGFTVTEVAKRVGVARSTIYKYFGMKSELLAFCADKYWFGGRAAHIQATERAAFRLVLESLAEDEDRGGNGPVIADLLSDYVRAAASSHERSLWLLTAAESVRAVRPPQFCKPPTESGPIRDGVGECLAAIVQGGRESDSRQSDQQLTDEACATMVYALNAFIWYEAFLNGPVHDDRRPASKQKPRIAGFPTLRLGQFGRQAPGRQLAQADSCRRAIRWLLQGAGIAGRRLLPLPSLPPGRLPRHVRANHPTGRTIHRLQQAANQIDFDDAETLVPWSFPKTPPLDPPPRLPRGRAAAEPSN